MSAVKRRTANDLLCGPIPAPLLEYAVVILVHGVSYQNLDHLLQQNTKISVQIARLNEELPLLTTTTISTTMCVFEEVLVVHTETLEELELLLCTANEVIDEYDLKLSECSILNYHHFTLAGRASELFITLIIKSNRIPPSIAPLLDVQVLVQYLETPIEQPRAAVLLAGRPEYTATYSQVSFNMNDEVQLCTPHGPSDQPQWYHTFLFRDCYIDQSIGIHLFHHPYMANRERWVLGEKVGQCGIQLEERLVRYLQQEEEGVSFTQVPLVSVQERLYLRIVIKLGVAPALTPNNIPTTVTKWGDIPTVITSEPQPTTSTPALPAVPTVSSVPSVPSAVSVAKSNIISSKSDVALPSHSAILNLLERHSTPQTDGHTTEVQTTSISLLLSEDKIVPDSNDMQLHSIIQQQATELKQYRDAVQKMGRDIVLCRDHIVKLKTDKSELADVVAELQHPIHDAALVNAPKDDLIREILRSRRAIKEQAEQMHDLSLTVSRLQQIKARYEQECGDIVELRNAHTAQNQLLQKLQEKVKVTQILEKTCRDQEKVIEKLENLLKLEDDSRPVSKHISFAPTSQILQTPPQLSLPAPIGLPKLEPLDNTAGLSDSYQDVPAETALKLRVAALQNQLDISQRSYDDEIAKLASQKMDLQLKLAMRRK